MLTTIEKIIAALVRLLSYEASKKAKRAIHIQRKAHANREAEKKAVANMQQAGALYRSSLYAQSDINERHADRASALASKIGSILE